MRKSASKNDKTTKGSQRKDRLDALSCSARSEDLPSILSHPGGPRLQLPPGEPDLDALRSVTREWLVPRLLEKFLRVHGVELKHVGRLANRIQPSLLGKGPLVPGAGPVSEEIRSQAKRKRNIGTLGRGGHGKVTPCS